MRMEITLALNCNWTRVWLYKFVAVTNIGLRTRNLKKVIFTKIRIESMPFWVGLLKYKMYLVHYARKLAVLRIYGTQMNFG